MYRGLCISGPMDGRVVSCDLPVLRSKKVDESEPLRAVGGNVVSLRRPTDTFVYEHLCGISIEGRDDTFDFWVPEEWLRKGKDYAASVAIQRIYDAYVDPER